MAGDELQLNGKLPPVVQCLDALSQLVEMHSSCLEIMKQAQAEIANLDLGLDNVVDDAFEKILNKSK